MKTLYLALLSLVALILIIGCALLFQWSPKDSDELSFSIPPPCSTCCTSRHYDPITYKSKEGQEYIEISGCGIPDVHFDKIILGKSIQQQVFKVDSTRKRDNIIDSLLSQIPLNKYEENHWQWTNQLVLQVQIGFDNLNQPLKTHTPSDSFLLNLEKDFDELLGKKFLGRKTDIRKNVERVNIFFSVRDFKIGIRRLYLFLQKRNLMNRCIIAKVSHNHKIGEDVFDVVYPENWNKVFVE